MNYLIVCRDKTDLSNLIRQNPTLVALRTSAEVYRMIADIQILDGKTYVASYIMLKDFTLPPSTRVLFSNNFTKTEYEHLKSVLNLPFDEKRNDEVMDKRVVEKSNEEIAEEFLAHPKEPERRLFFVSAVLTKHKANRITGSYDTEIIHRIAQHLTASKHEAIGEFVSKALEVNFGYTISNVDATEIAPSMLQDWVKHPHLPQPEPNDFAVKE